MPQAPPHNRLRRPFEPETFIDENVDVVGEGEDHLSDDSDLNEPENRKPRRTRYDCGFVFENLWRSRNKSGLANIWIPETIVFQNSSPTHWYFTRPQDGRIMKRNLGQEQFITSKKILEVMGGATGEIAAIFVNFKEVDGKRVATTMQYFDRQTLRAFLYVHDSNRNGILQKFVSIKQQIYGSASTTNQTLHTLHVTWKKGALRSTTVVQRSHALRIVEPKNGIDDGNDEENGNDDRRTSYLYAIAEALPYGQITLPLQSHLSKNIREACERLAKHVETVTDHAVRITRMVCYFKVGHKGQLWFNFPTSIDVDDSGIDHTFDLPVNMPSHAHAPRAPPTAHREEIYTADEPGTRSRDDTSSSAHMVALKTLDKSDREFELKNKAYLIPCCFCAETVESMMSCNITIRETISFLEQNYSESIEMTQKEPTGKRLETTQEGLHTPAERALRIWSDMRLTEGDEITLPELRWRMKQLQLPFHIVEKIETGLAYADTEILGVIDFNLWSTGVAYSAEQEKSQSARKEASRHSFAGNVITPRGTGAPSSPTFLAGTKEPQSPDTTPDTTQELLQAIMSGTRDFDSVLRAGTGRRKALEPLLIKNLRSNLYPKLFVRMTTRGALDRESSEFLERNVDVCSDCHKSVKWFLLQRGAPYWDAQLEKILQPVPGTAPQMTSRSPKTHRPITLIDRMWSRSMEMTKAGTFPVLQPLGYAQGNVVRANENDLAWSNRTNTAGGSPRSPPGRKPITASPRSRAVTNFRTPSGENGGVLVQSGNVVKLLHEVSDDDLLRELERRERSSLGKGSLGGASPGRGGSMEGASPRRGGSREEGRGEGEAGADVFLVDRNASSQRTPSLAAEEYVDKGWEEESARRRQLVNQVQQAEVARMGERAQEFGAPKLVGTAIEAKVSDPPRNAPVGAMEAFRDPQMEQPSVLDARVWSKVEASASFFPEPAPQHEPNNEAEMKTSPETEVDQEKKGSLFPEASEEMRRAAPIIQSVLRGRLARQTLSALLEREQRLAEQQSMAEELAKLSQQNKALHIATSSISLQQSSGQDSAWGPSTEGKSPKGALRTHTSAGGGGPGALGKAELGVKKKSLGHGRTSPRRSFLGTFVSVDASGKNISPAAGKKISPTRVHLHPGPSTGVPLGLAHRKPSVNSTKAREEYEQRQKQSRDEALGDYDEDQAHTEEHAEAEEQQQMQPKPPKERCASISSTARKKSHTVLDAVSQQVGVSLDDSDSD